MREGGTADQYGKDKGKSVAYAIAVQQAHKLGKSPKGFRTPSGVREAKAKFDLPKKEYQKTASLAGFFDELEKISQLYTPQQMAMLEEAARRTGETGVDPMNIAATRAWKDVEKSPEWQRETEIGRTGAPAAVGLMGAGMLGGGYGGYRLGRLIGMGGLGAGVGALGGGILGGALAQPVVKKLQERKREKMKTAMWAGFFEELEQIKSAQGPPEEATARGRAAASESASQSVRNLVTTGGIGEGRASGSGSEATAGPSPSMTGTGGASGSIGPTAGPPMPTGGTGETGGGLGIPSANIGPIPGGSPFSGGGGGGGLGSIPGGSPTGAGGGGGFPGEMAPVRGLGAGGAGGGGMEQGRMATP